MLTVKEFCLGAEKSKLLTYLCLESDSDSRAKSLIHGDFILLDCPNAIDEITW
jgi:hypothetical protein